MRRYSFDLEDFVGRYLGGDMQALADFCVHDPIVSPNQFNGICLGSSDCDETDLVWEVYNRLWGLEQMPESPPLDRGMVQPQYRGDTMNSFNTLFGRPIYGDPLVIGGDGIVGFVGLRKNGVEDELFDKVHQFWRDYHTIGNFIPMPNAKFNKRTLNTFRVKWHDYFDQFLHALYNELGGWDLDADQSFTALVGTNGFFWDQYRGEQGWQEFVERFMLEDYCGYGLEPKPLYDGFWYWERGMSREEYTQACHEYIDTATRLIRARGQRMIARLICDE